ncbi:alpha/beta fold hydrolase [Nocardiopsis alba]|uniref:alpha/beta fold hydrolase n=1 Tax=Nocardiopsis alba TaxID=53437 RepID=UPI00364CBD7C
MNVSPIDLAAETRWRPRAVTTSDGGVIRCLDTGGPGPALLLVSGLATSAVWWWRQLSGLGDDFRVVAMELRGHGTSHPGGGRGVSRCAVDVRDVITALGLRDTVLAGWSTGATVCLAYCDLFGTSSVRALAHVDMTPFLWLRESTDPHSRGWGHGATTIRGQEAFLAAWRTDFAATARSFVNGMFLPTSRPEELDLLHAEAGATCTDSLSALAWDGFFLDLRPVLPRLDLPVLVMAGAHSSMCPPGLVRWMVDHLPRGRAHIVERSRHAPFLEHTEEFHGAIRSLAGV